MPTAKSKKRPAAKKPAKAATEPRLVPRASKVPAQDSEYLTTAQGVRVSHTDDSLKAGTRGPTLMDDFHLREKLMHFDHERIPERVVHARGVGVHGVFEAYGTATEVTCAEFLEKGRVTPVFTRFSTVVGSRGSADTVRDVRGFAVKFYTEAGVFDLVGNNIPVFFIRDGIKFPDLIHAAKPEADREIPQAQTAHTTFWDFVSALPESPHMLMWVMSDRAIPRSLRMMEGFGVHTFRLVNAAGATSLVKFHWKPVLGVHGLVWEEAQTLAGVDPDFHRRDLYNAIGAGAYPEWELGLQIFPDREDQTFSGIDLLDATKLIPEELAPVHPVGRMTLNRNPTNFFAETEQVAFHTGHLVRGIEVTDDPLMQARLFSYLDTQLTRLGGPNFAQLPINRPLSAVNDNHRDGFAQQAVHAGRTPYLPNGVGGGCPFLAGEDQGGYVHTMRHVDGPKTRERSPDDEYTQATMFWHSISPPEQDHLVDAFTFELSKVDVPAIVDLMITRLSQVDGDLACRVGVGLGLVAPAAPNSAPVETSPTLAMITENSYPVDGRVVHILAADGCDLGGVRALKVRLVGAGIAPHVIAPHKGSIRTADDEITVDRSFHTSSPAEADAIIVAAGTQFTASPIAVTYVQSAARFFKTIAAWGDGSDLLTAASIGAADAGVVPPALRPSGSPTTSSPRSVCTATGSAAQRISPSPIARPEMPNGIDLLLDDHQRVSSLFDEFADGANPTAVGAVLDCLTAHDGAEHAALYPLSEALLNDSALIERCMNAHSRIKILIDHVRVQEGAALVDAVAALRAAVDEHVNDEETKLFPALSQAATPTQLEDLASRTEQNKQRVG